MKLIKKDSQFLTDESDIFDWIDDNFEAISQRRIEIVDGKVNVSAGVKIIKPITELKVNFGTVEDFFNTGAANLGSLKGLPIEIIDDKTSFHRPWLIIRSTASSFEEVTTKGVHELDMSSCHNMKSFKDIDKHVSCKKLYTPLNVKDNFLSVMKIDGLKIIHSYVNDKNNGLMLACHIVNRYLGMGKAGILAAQQELIDNDLDDYAEL